MLPNIGCDVCSISEVSHRNKDHRLAKRILSSKELQQYYEFNEKRQAEYLAGRFCAKEAIIKACPIELSMDYIHIELLDNQLVTIIKDLVCKVSISHFQDIVMAVALWGESHD